MIEFEIENTLPYCLEKSVRGGVALPQVLQDRHLLDLISP